MVIRVNGLDRQRLIESVTVAIRVKRFGQGRRDFIGRTSRFAQQAFQRHGRIDRVRVADQFAVFILFQFD